MNEQIMQPKSVVFTEQRVFTLGDEKFMQSLPIIESGYSKINSDSVATPVKSWLSDEEIAEGLQNDMDLFLQNAYRFYEKRDVILADSRLSKVQLPFAARYDGVPCLGDFLVWWKNYKCSQIEDADGNRHFIYNYFFKSSSCHYVDRKGRAFCAGVESSYRVSASFREAHEIFKAGCIYTGERDICTLEQVVKILDLLS